MQACASGVARRSHVYTVLNGTLNRVDISTLFKKGSGWLSKSQMLFLANQEANRGK